MTESAQRPLRLIARLAVLLLLVGCYKPVRLTTDPPGFSLKIPACFVPICSAAKEPPPLPGDASAAKELLPGDDTVAKEPPLLPGNESATEELLPGEHPDSGNRFPVSIRHYADGKLLLSVSVAPHIPVEATPEALQLWAEAQADAAVRRQGGTVLRRQKWAGGGLTGAEILFSMQTGKGRSISRLLIADNRKAQLQLLLTGEPLSALQTKKINKMFKSVAASLP